MARSIPNGGLFDDSGHVLGFISNLVVPPDLRKDTSTLFAIPIDRLKPVITGREKQAQADSADSLYSLGILAENQKNYDEAEHYFQQAIAVDPHYANAYFELGGIDYEDGDFDGQLAMYQKAAEYAPKDTDILFYLATAYEDKGLYDDAIGGYLRVLKLKPDHKDSLYQLGILYLTRGRQGQRIRIRDKTPTPRPWISHRIENDTVTIALTSLGESLVAKSDESVLIGPIRRSLGKFTLLKRKTNRGNGRSSPCCSARSEMLEIRVHDDNRIWN